METNITTNDKEFQVISCTYDDLSDTEKENVSNNGVEKEDSYYIKVIYQNQVIELFSDAMEGEDAIFPRALDWIAPMIRTAYKIGKGDGHR